MEWQAYICLAFNNNQTEHMKKLLSIFTVAAAASISLAQTNTNETAKMSEPEQKTSAAPIIVIDTSLGAIKAELYADKAPITVSNILAYVDSGFYNGTIFHRVIKGFMIQGGGFTEDMRQKNTNAQIKNEAANGLKNQRGTLAMARTSVVDSATSQFFINHKDNDFLNFRAPNPQGFGYCVFGKVVEGLDIVDKIADVKTGNKMGHGDVPVDPVTILSITRE